MAIDEKIRDEKLQYEKSFSREVAILLVQVEL